jgi:hypothetical protein
MHIQNPDCVGDAVIDYDHHYHHHSHWGKATKGNQSRMNGSLVMVIFYPYGQHELTSLYAIIRYIAKTALCKLFPKLSKKIII